MPPPPRSMDRRVEQRAFERRKRRRQLNLVWTDPLVAGDINMNIMVGIATSLLSMGLILNCILFGMPASPTTGVWPAYGYYFALPTCFNVLFIIVGTSMRQETLLRVCGALTLGFLLLDFYSFVTNVTWVAESVAGTLVSTAHQTLPGTFVTLFLLALMVLLEFLMTIRFFTVADNVHDLKRMHGLLSDTLPSGEDDEEEVGLVR